MALQSHSHNSKIREIKKMYMHRVNKREKERNKENIHTQSEQERKRKSWKEEKERIMTKDTFDMPLSKHISVGYFVY